MIKTNGTHIGENTTHQDQVTAPNTFSNKNIRVNPVKLILNSILSLVGVS